jgi:hypothetical protein
LRSVLIARLFVRTNFPSMPICPYNCHYRRTMSVLGAPSA